MTTCTEKWHCSGKKQVTLNSKSYSKNAVTKIQRNTIFLIMICFLYKYFLLNNIFFSHYNITLIITLIITYIYIYTFFYFFYKVIILINTANENLYFFVVVDLLSHLCVQH